MGRGSALQPNRTPERFDLSRVDAEVNRLNHQVLVHCGEDEWRRWNERGSSCATGFASLDGLQIADAMPVLRPRVDWASLQRHT